MHHLVQEVDDTLRLSGEPHCSLSGDVYKDELPEVSACRVKHQTAKEGDEGSGSLQAKGQVLSWDVVTSLE